MAAKCLLTKLGSERLPLTIDLVEVARTASQSIYQLIATYNSFESVLCLMTYDIHIDTQKL